MTPANTKKYSKKDYHDTGDKKSDFDTCCQGITINVQDKQVLK